MTRKRPVNCTQEFGSCANSDDFSLATVRDFRCERCSEVLSTKSPQDVQETWKSQKDLV